MLHGSMKQVEESLQIHQIQNAGPVMVMGLRKAPVCTTSTVDVSIADPNQSSSEMKGIYDNSASVEKIMYF